MKKIKLDLPTWLKQHKATKIASTKNPLEMNEVLQKIYYDATIPSSTIVTGLYMSAPVDRILTDIARSTFTKRGEYHLQLFGLKDTGEVVLCVDQSEIRGGHSLVYVLPGLSYVTNWWTGFLIYRIVSAPQ